MAGANVPIDRHVRQGVSDDRWRGRPSAVDTSSVGSAAWLLAALLFSAGAVHLAMVPSHYGEWRPEGVAFAVAGWLQVSLAAAVLLIPGRAVWCSVIAVNAGLIVVWGFSRTAGLPIGPNAWDREAISFIDVSCVAFEAAAIALAHAMLVRPNFLSARGPIAALVAIAGSVAVVSVASAALVSPSARNHAAGEHGAHSHDAVDDKGLSLLTNGHHHAIVENQLDPTTQAALDAQVRQTRQVARRYPTVADAEAAGYRRAGPYSPGLGVHYIKYGPSELNSDGRMDEDKLMHPLALIYEGTEQDSAIAGFMYYSLAPAEPEGFAGSNDVWHYHQNICLKYGPDGIDAPFGPDNAATEEQCNSVGGQMLQSTQWMVHVWSVAGYNDVPGGTFAEVNPDLACPDGTYYQLPPEEWAAHPLSTCRTETKP